MTIPMLQKKLCHDEVDDVGKPESMAQDGKEMLIGECVTDVFCTWNVETG